MIESEPILFALNASAPYGERVSECLSIPLGRHEEREFEDGEHKARSLMSVRLRDVFVVQSLYSDATASVNDKLCRLLFFIGALKDASAASVTAVVPYLCYARKDRKSQTRDPVTTRYVAALFEAVGVDRIVTLDVHNLAAFQNAFRCRTDHLEAVGIFVEHFAPMARRVDVAVISPDLGGIKRAETFRMALENRTGRRATAGFMEKRRAGGVVTGEVLVGDVRGRTVIIVDDLISTGGTIARSAKACRAAGASRVYAAATHGLFVGDVGKLLAEATIEQIVVGDTVPPFRVPSAMVGRQVIVLDTAPLVAEAVRRIHAGGSLVALADGRSQAARSA